MRLVPDKWQPNMVWSADITSVWLLLLHYLYMQTAFYFCCVEILSYHRMKMMNKSWGWLGQQPLTKFFAHSEFLIFIYLRHGPNFANDWPFSNSPTLLTKMKMEPESRRLSAMSVHKVLTEVAIFQKWSFCLMYGTEYPQRY